MFQQTRIVTVCSLSALLLGCSGDVISPGTENTSRELPNVAGVWVVTTTAQPVGTQGGAGTCSVPTFEITLTPGAAVTEGRRYGGSHQPLAITCTGLTPAATEASGLRDTTIQIPASPIDGSVFWTSCIGFGGCGPSELVMIFEFSNVTLAGRNPNGRRMGGTFSWTDAGGVVRITGTWSAAAR